MRYKNNKTGAIVDSPFTVFGNDWEAFGKEVETEEQENKEVNQEETETSEDEKFVEEEIDLDNMTNKQLEEFAKKEGIELTAEDKKNKDARIAAIVKAFEE